MVSESEQGRATISHVAALAGLSVGTVSRVFSGNTTVKPASRQRVEKAAAALGYRPHPVARALRTGRTRIIGLSVSLAVSQALAFNATAAAVIEAASSRANRAGYGLMLYPAESDPALEERNMETLVEERLAAVVSLPVLSVAAPYRPLQDAGLPLVFITQRPTGIAADRVAPDFSAGTALAAQHCLALGKRRVALLCADVRLDANIARCEGYVSAYRTAGIRPPAGLVVSGVYGVRDGYLAMEKLLDGPQPPDAVIAGHGTLTLGAYACLRHRRVRIPEQIAFVGTGSLPWSWLVEPSLTMIHVDGAELGRRAIEMALERLDPTMRQVSPREVLLPTRLVVRGSTDPNVPSLPELPEDWETWLK